MEVDNTTHYDIVLDLVRSKIVVACPKTSKDERSVRNFAGKLSRIGAERNGLEVHALKTHICEDSKHNVRAGRIELELLFLSGVTSLTLLSGTDVLFHFHFLGCLFNVCVHVLKDLGGNFIVLFNLKCSELFSIHVAPFKLALVVHSHGFSSYVLHCFQNVFGDLATIDCLV